MLFNRGAAMLRPLYFDGVEQGGAIPENRVRVGRGQLSF